jgi:hypothetical protein
MHSFLLTHTFALFLLLGLMSEGPAIGPPTAVSSAAVPAVTSPDPDFTFELLLWVIHPSKCIRTAS